MYDFSDLEDPFYKSFRNCYVDGISRWRDFSLNMCGFCQKEKLSLIWSLSFFIFETIEHQTLNPSFWVIIYYFGRKYWQFSVIWNAIVWFVAKKCGENLKNWKYNVYFLFYMFKHAVLNRYFGCELNSRKYDQIRLMGYIFFFHVDVSTIVWSSMFNLLYITG